MGGHHECGVANKFFEQPSHAFTQLYPASSDPSFALLYPALPCSSDPPFLPMLTLRTTISAETVSVPMKFTLHGGCYDRGYHRSMSLKRSLPVNKSNVTDDQSGWWGRLQYQVC